MRGVIGATTSLCSGMTAFRSAFAKVNSLVAHLSNVCSGTEGRLCSKDNGIVHEMRDLGGLNMAPGGRVGTLRR